MSIWMPTTHTNPHPDSNSLFCHKQGHTHGKKRTNNLLFYAYPYIIRNPNGISHEISDCFPTLYILVDHFSHMWLTDILKLLLDFLQISLNAHNVCRSENWTIWAQVNEFPWQTLYYFHSTFCCCIGYAMMCTVVDFNTDVVSFWPSSNLAKICSSNTPMFPWHRLYI